MTTEEITGYTNEAAKGANKAGRNPSSCFTVSVIPSINECEPFDDYIILIISFISSFEKNKVNHFPALTAPFPQIFLSELFIVFEATLLTNAGKLFPAKVKAGSVRAFLTKLPIQEPKDLPDYWVILDIWASLSFIFVDILIA